MPFIGQAVEDRDAGILRQLLDRRLGKASVFNCVIHLTEHARRVLHAFLMTKLRRLRVKKGCVGPLIIGSHFKSGPRAGRRLFKNQRNVFAAKHLLLVAHALGLLEIDGKINEIIDFSGRVMDEREQAAIFEIEGHDENS